MEEFIKTELAKINASNARKPNAHMGLVYTYGGALLETICD